MRTFLAALVVLPTTRASPPAGARFRHTPSSAAAPGRPDDLWIVACCLVRELPLATFNINDHADFPNKGLDLVH